MTDTTPTPADRPADQLRAAVRAIHALKAPAPFGSPHYRSGWDDGLEAAMDAVRGMDLAVARQLLGTTPITADDLGTADGQQKTRALARLHASLTPIPEDPAPAVWVDGDPLMEAMAAAVYEQCRTEPSIVVDDPRNIAAVAATVARQLLGTTMAEGAAAALEPQDHPGADLFVALRAAGLDVDEANRRIHAYAGMVLRQEKAIADSVTAHTKALLARRTETLRKRAEAAEAERDQLRADRAAERETTPPAAPAAPEEPQ
ncbi:hypothetical protein [Streptomyces sp. bgisy029]|uniref:hypothetical protein n=1 Tax=Streptomyces sp. bgisy029 TaxID=3413771 RepID=UPI003D75328F